MTNSTTAVIAIGNSDDKLTQAQWSKYVELVDQLVRDFSGQVFFNGYSPTHLKWQNAAWIFEFEDSMENEENFTHELKRIAKFYNQDSIALVLGDTIFIRPESE